MRGSFDKKEAKEEVLRSFIESSRKILCGLNPSDLEANGALVGKLVNYGRLNEIQADLVSRQLKAQLNRSQNCFDTQLSAIVQGVVQRLKAIADEELIDIERRLTRLEGAKLRGTSPAKQL